MAISSSPKKRRQNFNIPGQLTIAGKKGATIDKIEKVYKETYYLGEYPGYNNHGWDNMDTISSFVNSSTYDITVDFADGTLWISKKDIAEIDHLNRDGSLITTITPGSGGTVYGLAQDMADGSLWFVDNANATIYHIGQTGSVSGSFTAPDIAPTGIAVDRADGTLWIVDNGNLYHLNKDGTQIASFPAPANAVCIEMDQFDGTLYITDSAVTTYHYDREGNEIEKYTFGTTSTVYGISFDPANGNLWIKDTSNDTVYYVW